MKLWVKILLALFIIGVIAAFYVYKYVYNKPHPDFEKMTPAYSIPAADLYNTFKANKTASEKKYNGQVIEIRGTLSKVEAKDSLVIAVFVFNQGMFGDEGIRCSMLKKYNEEAKKLSPGTSLKIKGYCTGYNETDVILEQCCLIK